MSLINDALKHAQQTQQEYPPTTPSLEFRAVEPGPERRRNAPLLLVGAALVAVALFGLVGVLAWFVAQPPSAPLPVAARVADPPPAPLPQSAPAADVMTPPAAPNANGIPVVAAPTEALPPAPLKLQGIFFNPQNPSAVVSGQTVYLGDRVNGFRLIAISPVAVTLASATETNVLSLSGP